VSRQTAPFGRRAAIVTAREEHGAYVVLRARDGEGPNPQPGQFYMLAAAERWGGGDGERPFLPRAFSVLRARARTDGVDLDFMIEDVGPGTNRLAELDAGESLLLVGPLGNGFAAPRDGRAALLVGGGVGIAPLAIWQDELGDDTRVLLGFRDEHHAEGAALLKRAIVASDDGSVGHHGLVTELLENELEALDDRGDEVQVYACGPPAMLEAIRAICADRGVPAQLALESGMACGFGACFGCVVPTQTGYIRLCVDGPVLEAVELADASFIGSSAGAELPGVNRH
jgi:dihydroorotate dehydrogenase electron transfer subunit